VVRTRSDPGDAGMDLSAGFGCTAGLQSHRSAMREQCKATFAVLGERSPCKADGNILQVVLAALSEHTQGRDRSVADIPRSEAEGHSTAVPWEGPGPGLAAVPRRTESCIPAA